MNCLRRLKFASAVMAMLVPAAAMAQVTPVIFERTDIRIDHAPIGGKDGEVTIQRNPVTYNIELRSEDALKLEYIHTLNNLTDPTGVMIVFAAPTMAPLPALQVFTAVDALFLAEDGTVLQILPNVALGEMTQDIMARDPVKAFLFLKAGQVAAQSIQPHDTVVGTMFTPSPAVMQ